MDFELEFGLQIAQSIRYQGTEDDKVVNLSRGAGSEYDPFVQVIKDVQWQMLLEDTSGNGEQSDYDESASAILKRQPKQSLAPDVSSKSFTNN